MNNKIDNIYFVVNADHLIQFETVSSSEGYAKVRFISGFLPFDKYDAVDVDNVWKISEKNGCRLQSIAMPPCDDAAKSDSSYDARGYP